MAALRTSWLLLALRLAVVLAANAGAPCTTSSGKTGVCIRLDQCPALLEAIKAGKPPDICTYERFVPIACCPSEMPNLATSPTDTNPTPGQDDDSQQGSKARQMCKKYEECVYERVKAPALIIGATQYYNLSTCAMDATPLIVGGDLAKPKEFPHMALVGFGEENNIAWYCGGSLISTQFVLTAGHCIRSRDRGDARWVRLGELILDTDADATKPQQFAISEIIIHPEYKPPAHYNDIALLKLEKDITCNAFIRPACLHVDHDIPWLKAVATGWGKQEWVSNQGSKELRKVSLPFQSTEKCQNSFKSIAGSRRLRNGINSDSMVCAGDLSGNKDTCQGDSGGPLQVPDVRSCMYEIVGITSFGKTICGAKDSPAVYTRVSHYITWVENTVWPDK